jgi:hypothetical protein
MWLADKLPRNWSRTRVMIYGYQSQIMGTKSRQTLGDIATTFKNRLVDIRKFPNVSNQTFQRLAYSLFILPLLIMRLSTLLNAYLLFFLPIVWEAWF